jgi:hypothetical protein
MYKYLTLGPGRLDKRKDQRPILKKIKFSSVNLRIYFSCCTMKPTARSLEGSGSVPVVENAGDSEFSVPGHTGDSAR